MEVQVFEKPARGSGKGKLQTAPRLGSAESLHTLESFCALFVTAQVRLALPFFRFIGARHAQMPPRIVLNPL